MNRRDFMLLTAAVSLAPAIASAADKAARSWAKTYEEGLVQAELAAGKTVFLDFKADWCGTCQAQERVITALLDENPAYAENVSIIIVDWDEDHSQMLIADMNIPRRSTLVAVKGDKELGRLVAQTGKAEIKALLDAALAAATGA